MWLATVFVFGGMVANDFWLTITLWCFAGIAMVGEDEWLSRNGRLDKRMKGEELTHDEWWEKYRKNRDKKG